MSQLFGHCHRGAELYVTVVWSLLQRGRIICHSCLVIATEGQNYMSQLFPTCKLHCDCKRSENPERILPVTDQTGIVVTF